MDYNFDEIIDRTQVCAKKYVGMEAEFGRTDLFPMWIADMDFKCPDFIIDPLVERVRQGVYGYTVTPDSYWQAIIDWEREQHGWNLERNDITFVAGGIRALAYVIFHFTREGDAVLVQPPVYKPFLTKPVANGRRVVCNPLICRDGEYFIDFDNLEEQLRTHRPRLMILCNPQNPLGRIWDREDLQRVASLCARYGTLVMSDELHSDMPLYGHRHTPFATVSEEARLNSVTLCAPSKTFNLPGLVTSFFVVQNPELRKGFFEYLEANEFSEAYFTAFIATEMAFRHGLGWRDQMLSYVQGNIDYAYDFLKTYVPAIKFAKPMSSYVVWLDCHGLGATHEDVRTFFLDKARLALNDGINYGPGGEFHMRLNLGTPRANVEKGLSLIREAYEKEFPNRHGI